jgi:hypothetical protein
VSLIPLVDVDFVRSVWIRNPSEEPSVCSGARILTKIDFPGSNAGLDFSCRVDRFSGNDIPELVLNEEALSGMHPVVEIVRIKLTERERRRFGKGEGVSEKRGCVGHSGFESFVDKVSISIIFADL